MERSELGRMGEDLAARWLEERGWRIEGRNVRTREGEIDIIASRAGVLAFVEVKTRRTRAFGAPVEAVTPRKARRIRGLAATYLLTRATRGMAPARAIRFDVVDLLADARGAFAVTHFEDAF